MLKPQKIDVHVPYAFDSEVRRVKLVAPSLVSRPVVRQDIAQLLTGATDAKLILFRAPAGFGKTMAMRQYYDGLARKGVAVAWLTLDPLDDDFRRLMLHLVAAFDLVLSPGEDLMPRAGARPELPDIDNLAFNLVDRISDCQHPFAVFIDEFETVSNRSIDDLLRLILDRLPPHGEIVIASRETPSLPLGRLRAHGKLVEVDQSLLRFSRAETASFLRYRFARPLSEPAVAKLHDNTEGWPAAVWLATAALEHRDHPEAFIASFSGSDTAVADYLAEEVFSRHSEEMQEFLLKTSILKELSKPLCDAVCERNDSDVLLARLERSNVCISTVGGDRRLHRYHPLFAGFLLSQLERMLPDRMPGLHLAAARWFSAEGRPIPAIEHALASGQIDYALSLLAANVENLLFHGRFRLLARWLDALPEETLRLQPRLAIARIWALTFTRRSLEALRLLDSFEARSGPLSRSLAWEINALRPYILATLDRHEEGLWLAEEALRASSPPDSFAYNILITIIATWRFAANQPAEAIKLMQRTRQRAGMEQFPTLYAICMEGLVDFAQGRARQAIAHFRVALSNAAASFGSRSIGKTIAAVFLAEALYETDAVEEAEQLLTLYLPSVREFAIPDHLIISHVTLARIALDRGDADHAFRLLSELEYHGRQDDLPRVVAAALLERARIALLRNDVAEARSQYERARESEGWKGLRGLTMPANDVETVEVCRFRLMVHGVDKGASLQAIKSEIKAGQSSQRNRRALTLNILFAARLHADGHRRLAMRKIDEALRTACHEGLIRPFLDEGTPIVELLREFQVARKAAADLDPENQMTRFVDRILRRAGCAVGAASSEEEVDATAVLTAREQQILESLALGLSNIAIARNLFVTETTVRSHLRKINVKLGAGNRTQCVSIARRLGLLR